MRIKSSETVIDTLPAELAHLASKKDTHRIDDLISNYLIEIAISNDGWSKLFRDPHDNRLWELTYIESSMHGGGIPKLLCISIEDAALRFNI